MRCIKCNEEHDGSIGSGKYCSRTCANSRVFSDSTKLKKSIANKGRIPHNKGKNCKIASKCKFCHQDIMHWESTPKKYHAECWKKCSGGYRKGSGRGRSGWYKGYWCDSSYELVWIIYQLDHNLPFERNKEKFPYIWENRERMYIPDFIQNGELIEIKGYVNSIVEAKLKSIKNLKVLFRHNLTKEFEYVLNTYGKDFIKLYEPKSKV